MRGCYFISYPRDSDLIDTRPFVYVYYPEANVNTPVAEHVAVVEPEPVVEPLP